MTIIVYYKQVSLVVYSAIAQCLKLTAGQQLSSFKQAIEILNLNTTHKALVEMAKQRCSN
ncbi:hypothetical protein [Spirosoma aerophilum]